MLESKEIRLLGEIGFIASGRGSVAHAKAIFSALQLVRPEKAFSYVGNAMALLNAGKYADASSLLADVRLPEGEEADTVEAILGLALQLEGRANESTRVLQGVVARSASSQDGNDGVRLAQALLDAVTAPRLAAAP